jgi:phosphoglycolate phosphatase-like HAD superfamily hydrolase
MASRIQKEWISMIEEEKYLLHDEVYCDTYALLGKFDGWRRILVTARRNKTGLYMTLDRLGLSKFFDAVCLVDPFEDVIKAKAEILCKEKALLYFGDTRTDYKAAEIADVRFEYRSEGFHSYETVNG